MISPAYGHDPVFPPSGQFDDGLDPVDLVPGDPRGAMSLQTAWLKSFLAVADCGGFGAATLGLHLSQSRVQRSSCLTTSAQTPLRRVVATRG